MCWTAPTHLVALPLRTAFELVHCTARSRWEVYYFSLVLIWHATGHRELSVTLRAFVGSGVDWQGFFTDIGMPEHSGVLRTPQVHAELVIAFHA